MAKTPLSIVNGRVDWWVLWWFVATLPFRATVLFWYGLALVGRGLFYAAVVTVIMSSWIVTAAFVAGALMPATQSQGQFFQAGQTVATTLAGVWNDIVVSTYNNLADCVNILGFFWNSLVAFVQAIIATVAAEFGLDLFEFTLRGEIDEFKLAEVRAAVYARLKAAEDHREGVGGEDRLRYERNRARLVMKATRIARKMMEMGLVDGAQQPAEVQRRLTIVEIVQTLCDILEFVIGLFIALLDTFRDFVLLIIEVLLDIVVTVVVNWDDAEFVVVLAKVILTTLLELIDPGGCFTPIEDQPSRLIACMCPHAYNSYLDVSGNFINGVGGCICPGFNINGDLLEDILRPCLRYPVLVQLLVVIEAILNGIKAAIAFITSKYEALVDLVGELSDVIDAVLSAIGIFLRSLEEDGDGIQEVDRGGGRLLVEVVRRADGAVVYSFETAAHNRTRSEEHRDRCYYALNQTRLLMEEADVRMDQIHEFMRVNELRDEGERTARQELKRWWNEQLGARRESTYQSTVRGYERMREYARNAKGSLAAGVLFDSALRYFRSATNARLHPDLRARMDLDEASMAQDAACDEGCRQDYVDTLRGTLKLARVFFEATTEAAHRWSGRRWTRRADGSADLGYPTVAEYRERFRAAGIDVGALASKAMKTSLNFRRMDRARHGESLEAQEARPTEAERLLKRVVGGLARASLTARAYGDPQNLAESVESLLRRRPQFAGTLDAELDAIEGHADTLAGVVDILNAAKNVTRAERAAGAAPLTREDRNEIRRLLREQGRRTNDAVWEDALGFSRRLRANPLAALFRSELPASWTPEPEAQPEGEPDPKTEPEAERDAPTGRAKRVIVVTFAVAGLGVFLFAINAAAFALVSLVPVLVALVVLLSLVVTMSLGIAADGVFELGTTIMNNGNPQGMDYVSTYLFALEPAIADSVTQGWDNFDFTDYLEDVGDRTGLVAQYVASSVVRQAACVFPGGGVFNSCPPLPRYDREEQQPAVTFPEYLWEILRCEQGQSCQYDLDCSGNSPCYCEDGNYYADENSPCQTLGFCSCWPYNNPLRRFEEVQIQADLDPRCEDLGWVVQGITLYDSDSNTAMVWNWARSALRSWRFVANRMSTGLFLPWMALSAYAFSLIPCLKPFSRTIVHATFWFNILSVLTVPVSTRLLLSLEPNQGLPVVGGAITEVVSWLRFPNWADNPPVWTDGLRKGEASTAEWVCLVANVPQLSATALVGGAAFVFLATWGLGGGVLWVFYVLFDVALFPVTFIFLLLQELYVSAVLSRRRVRFNQALSSWRAGRRMPLQLHAGLHLPAARDASGFRDAIWDRRGRLERAPLPEGNADAVRAARRAELAHLDRLEAQYEASLRGETPARHAGPRGVLANLPTLFMHAVEHPIVDARAVFGGR